jgi:hypothetical protein
VLDVEVRLLDFVGPSLGSIIKNEPELDQSIVDQC